VSGDGGTADGAVIAQTDAVRRALDAALPAGTLIALVRYGSAVVGGLRPDSDLDLFGVLARRLTEGEARALIRALVPISSRAERPAGWRPVELTLVVLDEVRPWRYPPRFDFQYGEWLREDLVAGNPAPWPPVNPDVAILLTMVRDSGSPILGPHPADLLDPVPRQDLERAMVDELPSLVADLESDTRNVLLTLARMWTTVATGRIVSKDAAAAWACEHSPPPARVAIEAARVGYIGSIDDRWDDLAAARSAAEVIVDHIRAAVTPVAGNPSAPSANAGRG
jgi:predicted nucleotidyltransferase